MEALQRLLATALGLVALAVAFHFMFASLYTNPEGAIKVWSLLDWFMALGLVAALVANCRRKQAMERRGTDGAVTREYLAANLAFYATVLVTIWFFWNWLDFLVGILREGQPLMWSAAGQAPPEGRFIMWALIDPLVALVLGITGARLWRSGQ